MNCCRHTLLAALTLISVLCVGQEITSPIEKWTKFPVPTNIDTLRRYNNAENDWTVISHQGRVYVTNRSKSIPKLPFEIAQKQENPFELGHLSTVLKVDNGYLVGFNNGEWGGNLYWYSNDGMTNYKIIRENIVQLIVRDREIYAVVGLAHLTESNGSILRIEKNAKNWIAENYQELPCAPRAIALDDKKNFLIVTSKSLVSVDLNGSVRTLIAEGFWNIFLYPTSIIVENNMAYIGMRQGVFKYYLESGKQEWLIP